MWNRKDTQLPFFFYFTIFSDFEHPYEFFLLYQFGVLHIDVESRIWKAVVLSEFLEDSLLVGDTVALAVEHIILAQTAV